MLKKWSALPSCMQVPEVKPYYDALKKKGLKSRMLVQVHDEILLEVPLAEADEVRKLVKEAMEGAAKLSVPLVADIHTGASWYEAK